MTTEIKTSLPSAIINAIKQLGEERASSFVHKHIKCRLMFGGQHQITIDQLQVCRNPHESDRLHMKMFGFFRIGYYKHHAGIFEGKDALLTEPNLQLIEECMTSLGKKLTNICSVCLQFHNGESRVVCESCELSIALAKFLPRGEVTFGEFKQSTCAICQEEFGRTDVLGHTNRCQHVFHYSCLCRMSQNQCPLCRCTFALFKRVDEREWSCFWNEAVVVSDDGDDSISHVPQE